jgi:site-specific DNA recombinase
MQGQWNHGRAYYRCRYPLDYAIDEHEHPPSVYVRQDAITRGLDPWLASLFDDDRIDETCEILAGASEPERETEDREARLRRAIADVDRRLEGYRAVLDQGGDAAVVARWISDAQRERKLLLAQLGEPVPGGKLTKSQVRALVAGLRDIVSTLADADPEDKAELYRELGVTLTYSPDGRVNVQVLPRGVNVRVGGGT